MEAAVGVPVCVSVALVEGVALPLRVVDAVPESEPVLDGLAPLVKEAVGVLENDLERLCVELGVLGGVDELDGVALAVGELLPVGALVSLDENELLGVIDGLESADNDAVGVSESDELSDAVVEDVLDAVPVTVDDIDPVGVADGVIEAVALPVSVGLAVEEGVPLVEGVPLALAP